MSKKNPFEKIILRENNYAESKIESPQINNEVIKLSKNIDSNLIKGEQLPKKIPVTSPKTENYSKSKVNNYKKEEPNIGEKYCPILGKDTESLKELPKTKIRYIDIIIEKEQKQVYSHDDNEDHKDVQKLSHNDDALVVDNKNGAFLSGILDAKHDYRSEVLENSTQDSGNNSIKNLKNNLDNNKTKNSGNPSAWKNSHKAFKTREELNELTLYDLIVYLNSINPNFLSRKEQDRLISIVAWKIGFLRKLITKNNKKVFLIANYNVAGALEKLLINIKRKIKY